MARDQAYRDAEKKIEQARREQATELELAGMGLTELPESLSQLSQLKMLYLSGNQLTSLPESLSQLTQLKWLYLDGNRLTSLPESLSQLTQLRRLFLDSNQLTPLPESLSQLTHLQGLYLSSNQLTLLPEWLSQLRQLLVLYVHGNQLTSLPESLSQLTHLQRLYLGGNQLTSLPESLSQLTRLKRLDLDNNPLNPDLDAAYAQGLDAVMAYLKELAKGASKRYEAKLLILGDGDEGKTCVARAARGLPFEDQVTTRGVDVVQWPFPHPDTPEDQQKQITLNIWDFEGQEINHQTHQFFLTGESLYLLVFKCRDQFRMDRAEYWLDTIRARAGKVKVAMVITECEQRTPYVPQDKLQAQYGDLLGEDQWLFPVGCEDNSGVAELQEYLKRSAADLEFMGRKWPESYSRAEDVIEELAESGAEHIDRSGLYHVFAECNIDQPNFDDVAAAMATLGVITQFPDCHDLANFVVLQPQWLTKAISHIMEDQQLTDDKGEISFQRMQEVWDSQGHGDLFAVFHNCLKEFELCYDLEDRAGGCLVPLRFGYQQPEIPWTNAQGMKERRAEYKLNVHPPMGLMSRFIVKTHHMIASGPGHPKGVYWHNGVFLRTGEGPLRSEALCQFDQDERTLSVQVRAAFPQNMIEQIHAYVRAVFAFFSGMEPVRSLGCISVDEQTNKETQCQAVHSENKISFAMESQEKVACEHGRHHIDPMQLVFGISSFGTEVSQMLRRELDKTPAWAEPLIQSMGTLLTWADDNQQLLQQLQQRQTELPPEITQQLDLKLREYLGHVDEMLDQRHRTSAPGIFSLKTVDGNPWNPKSYFEKEYVLTPFCECEGAIHPCDDGSVTFCKDRKWWDKTAPWIARGTKILSVGLQLAFAGMPLALGNSAFAVIKNDVTFMKELTKHLELTPGANVDDNETIMEMAEVSNPEGSIDLRGEGKDAAVMKAALSRFLEALAPDNYRARQWGSLSRFRMPDNSYRWLCKDCIKQLKR